MIVVSGVNDCRYCSYFHASEGLKTGLNQKELAALLVGSVEACPPQEAAALLYAQHWAESNGNPDREARQNLVDNYGGDTAEAIELVLRAIRMGNLMGNTWDYLLYRISFGHWGA